MIFDSHVTGTPQLLLDKEAKVTVNLNSKWINLPVFVDMYQDVNPEGLEKDYKLETPEILE